MDIDPNFHESERLFFEKLDHIKKDDDAAESDDEVKNEPLEKEESSN